MTQCGFCLQSNHHKLYKEGNPVIKPGSIDFVKDETMDSKRKADTAKLLLTLQEDVVIARTFFRLPAILSVIMIIQCIMLPVRFMETNSWYKFKV